MPTSFARAFGASQIIAVDVRDEGSIEAAVEGIVTSAFGFSGQKCSACSRAIVHKDVVDAVVAGVVERTGKLVSVGSGLAGEASMGAVVDANQFKSINEYIEIGKSEGREVYRGDVPSANGYYVPPVIYADVPRSARIACEEKSNSVTVLALPVGSNLPRSVRRTSSVTVKR